MTFNRFTKRRGVSLFEVIAAVTLLTMVMVPITSMMATSGGMLKRSQRTEQRQLVRDAFRWIRQDITLNSITTASDLRYTSRATSQPAIIARSGDTLVYRSGSNQIILLSNVKGFQWTSGRTFDLAVVVFDVRSGLNHTYQLQLLRNR